MTESSPAPGGPRPQHDLAIGVIQPPFEVSVGRLRSMAWILMVMAGFGLIAFSAYMAASSVEQRNRIVRLDEQTRILREAIQYDHDWQVVHNRIIVDLAQSIRFAADRNKALLVAALKDLHGWSDADVDEAIRKEMESARRRPAIPELPRLGPPADMGVPAPRSAP